MRKLYIFLIILILILIIYHTCFYKENFNNDENNYTINLFNQYKNYNCNKAILYNNKKIVAESDNDKCIWNPISSKYNLEIKSLNNESFNYNMRKIDNNIYTLGDTYIKCINHSLFKSSKSKDFRDNDYTIHHNFIKNKDFISIKKNNKNLVDINYKYSIKDKLNELYKIFVLEPISLCLLKGTGKDLFNLITISNLSI